MRPGDTLLLNDGLIVLTVDAVRGEQVHTTRRRSAASCRTTRASTRQGGGLTAPALTAKDMEDIKTAMALPGRLPGGELPEERHRHGDGAPARATWPARRCGHKPELIAKIERSEAIPGARGDPARPATASWSRAATSRSRSATRRCRRCRSDDPHGARDGQVRHHRDADDGVDDRQPGADPRRGERRRQRGARRHRRGDAVAPRPRPAATRSRRSR